jgi:hypothetical protein
MRTQLVATALAALLGMTACGIQAPSGTQPPAQSTSVAADQHEADATTTTEAADTLIGLQLVPYTEDQIAQVLETMRGDFGTVVPKGQYQQKIKEDTENLKLFKVTPESCRPFVMTPENGLGEAVQEGMTAGVLRFGTDVPGQSSMLASIDPQGGHPGRFEALQSAASTCSSVSFSYKGLESTGSVQRIESLSSGNVLTVHVRWKTPAAKNTTPQEGVWMFAHSGSVMICMGSVLTSTTMNDVPQSQVDGAAARMKGKLLQAFDGFSKVS